MAKPARVEHLQIPAKDGFSLAASFYEPETFNGRVVIINSATGVKRYFYHRFARYLSEQNFAVLTYDYRGIGDSRPRTLNKFRALMHEWGELDFAGILNWVFERKENSKIVVVAHSVGGQIFSLAANADRVSGLLMVACQSGYWGLWPIHLRFFIFIFWYFFLPIITIPYSYFPARFLGMGEDLPAGVALEWASWGRKPNYLLGKKSLQANQKFEKIRVPIYSYSIKNDFFAPVRAVDELLTFYKNAPFERKELSSESCGQKIGHFDFFRERFRQTLWTESATWLYNVSEEEES